MTVINLATFRGANESDNAAFNRAMGSTAATLEIYFPAGQGKSGGAYEISTQYWANPPTNNIPSQGNITRSNVTLYGDGIGQSVIRQPTGSQIMLMAHVDPGAPQNRRSNITIRDLTLEGNQTRSGGTYDENNHLVRIAGVDGFRAERVLFRDFGGDGLNLSSPQRSLVLKNTDLVVDACRFDGINNNCRNGISILDCVTWSITGCSFVNIGNNQVPNPGPGAIDVEPEEAASVVTDGTIYNCSFENLGGNAVALLNGRGATTARVNFTYCSVRNARGGQFGILATAGYTDVVASDNYAENVGVIARFDNSKRITFQNTTVRGGQFLRFGGVEDLKIQNNALVNCGGEAVFLQSGDILRVDVLNNQLHDCGTGGGLSPMYYVQVQNIKVSYLKVKGNVVHVATPPLKLTDIGYVVGGYDKTIERYNNVDRRGNTPETIRVPEGLTNQPE